MKRTALLSKSISAPARAFLDRTSGLNQIHRNAYIKLINGLVTDGIWAKLDLLQIYATQDQTTANLNLISSSYTATTSGSPTWAADVGYTTASNKYVDTGWMPTNGVQYTQDSAHVSVWSGSTGTSFRQIFNLNTTSGGQTWLKPNDGGSAFCVVNDGAQVSGVSVPDRSGFFGINRISSATKQIYRNGVHLGDISRASLAPTAFNLLSGGNNTTTGSDYAGIIRSLGAGASLNASEWAAYHARMARFMAAIGATP